MGAFAVNGSHNTVASNISELTVPGANMPFAANFKGAPATGKDALASVPFANIRVNQDNTQEAQNEPFVAVNPSNSRHIVVGANNWAAGNGRFEVTAYVSFDGGATWQSHIPISIGTQVVSTLPTPQSLLAQATQYTSAS